MSWGVTGITTCLVDLVLVRYEVSQLDKASLTDDELKLRVAMLGNA